MKARSTEVIVVGGGPAGLAVATKLSRSGIGVVVMERESQPGGVPRHCPHPSFGLREFRRPLSGPTYASRMVSRAETYGADIHVDTTVVDLDTEKRAVTTTSPEGLVRWEAGAIVLATGCRERPRAARRISGSRPAGIYTTGELQQFTYLLGEPIGKRALVYGAEHVSFSALMSLRHAGIEPVAIVTSQPSHQSYKLLQKFATRFGKVPLYTNHTIASIEGADRVSGVWLYFPGWGAWPGSDQQVVDAGSLRDKHRRQSFVECDTVIVSGDWVAEGDLAFRAGIAPDPALGARPEVGPDGETIRSGIFAAGTVVRPGESAMSATRDGEGTAEAVRMHLLGFPPASKVRVVPESNYVRWLWPNWIDPEDASPLRLRVDAWLDRCAVLVKQEDRTLDRIHYRHVVPGRTYQVKGLWMSRIRGKAPIHVDIEIE